MERTNYASDFFQKLYAQTGSLIYSGAGYKADGRFLPHGTCRLYRPDGALMYGREFKNGGICGQGRLYDGSRRVGGRD